MSFNYNDIDNYEFKESIGQGNFGKVKLAIFKPNQQEYAIKILSKKKLLKSQKTNSHNKFNNNELMLRFSHINVIYIYNIIETEENFYIIMEYCEKGELFDYIVKKHRLSTQESLLFFYQLINGVEYLHSQGIAHRDLKPENLLLTKNLTLKIIDFGLSSKFNGINLLSTKCGSPSYASPEIIKGNCYDGFKTDVWCCGIILYVLFCGYLPFEGENNKELFKNILEGKIEFPAHLNRDVKDLILKILNSNPDERIGIKEIKENIIYKKGEKIWKKLCGKSNNINNVSATEFNNSKSTSNLIKTKNNTNNNKNTNNEENKENDSNNFHFYSPKNNHNINKLKPLFNNFDKIFKNKLIKFKKNKINKNNSLNIENNNNNNEKNKSNSKNKNLNLNNKYNIYINLSNYSKNNLKMNKLKINNISEYKSCREKKFKNFKDKINSINNRLITIKNKNNNNSNGNTNKSTPKIKNNNFYSIFNINNFKKNTKYNNNSNNNNNNLEKNKIAINLIKKNIKNDSNLNNINITNNSINISMNKNNYNNYNNYNNNNNNNNINNNNNSNSCVNTTINKNNNNNNNSLYLFTNTNANISGKNINSLRLPKFSLKNLIKDKSKKHKIPILNNSNLIYNNINININNCNIHKTNNEFNFLTTTFNNNENINNKKNKYYSNSPNEKNYFNKNNFNTNRNNNINLIHNKILKNKTKKKNMDIAISSSKSRQNLLKIKNLYKKKINNLSLNNNSQNINVNFNPNKTSSNLSSSTKKIKAISTDDKYNNKYYKNYNTYYNKKFHSNM